MDYYPSEVGVLFLQALNHFQRYAYVRQAHARERKAQVEQQYAEGAHAVCTRVHSNSTASNQQNGTF